MLKQRKSKLWNAYDKNEHDRLYNLLLGLMREDGTKFTKLKKMSLSEFYTYVMNLADWADISAGIVINIYDDLITNTLIK